MKTYAVGGFKTHFSEMIERVRAGEEIIISLITRNRAIYQYRADGLRLLLG